MTRPTALLAAALALAGCAPGGVGLPLPLPLPAPPPSGGAPAGLEGEVLALVNRHRAERGLPALRNDARIADVARRHSATMAARRRLDHDGFDARAAEIGRFLPLAGMAENVALDSRPDVARSAVQGWIASPGHRANIEGSFRVTGVGIARAADGVWYFTQIFVQPGG